jgi:predicted nucleic acid-binding protein
MSGVLLDSNMVIDLLRGRPEVVDRIRQIQARGDDLYTCAIVADEVSVGLRSRERDVASAVFEGFREAPLGIAEGRLAGWWRARYAARGRTLSQPDALIAAAAVGVGARLATGNPKDFPMRELSLEPWPGT